MFVPSDRPASDLLDSLFSAIGAYQRPPLGAVLDALASMRLGVAQGRPYLQHLRVAYEAKTARTALAIDAVADELAGSDEVPRSITRHRLDLEDYASEFAEAAPGYRPSDAGFLIWIVTPNVLADQAAAWDRISSGTQEQRSTLRSWFELARKLALEDYNRTRYHINTLVKESSTVAIPMTDLAADVEALGIDLDGADLDDFDVRETTMDLAFMARLTEWYPGSSMEMGPESDNMMDGLGPTVREWNEYLERRLSYTLVPVANRETVLAAIDHAHATGETPPESLGVFLSTVDEPPVGRPAASRNLLKRAMVGVLKPDSRAPQRSVTQQLVVDEAVKLLNLNGSKATQKKKALRKALQTWDAITRSVDGPNDEKGWTLLAHQFADELEASINLDRLR